ncbi:hypothetical protein CDL12_21068 [Handroanthus impetiginosus]|uniref:Uncharacterized protein n=1 Tax=Handroanthus impetiginosus TaxID=429701 RepID=A0A2G9GMZ3_9LAMI|nr:hypothetical protein CDL12_21068 [Handroanthus impetiginosus]
MGSEQLRRENVSDETVVEKDRVPKMTTHFESLTEKAREDQLQHVPHVERTEEIRKEETHGGDCSGQWRQGPSLEELSDMRVMAKQNSTAGAEEQYEKAKEMCVSKAKIAAEYVVAAKDVALESGRGAAEYVGKVAAGVKDQAVEAGRETAYYTRVAVADATKAVAEVTSTVSEKAAVVKDKVVDTGKTVVGYAGEKIAAAKDAVVGSEEKVAESAERKKVEAWRDFEEKRASYEKVS